MNSRTESPWLALALVTMFGACSGTDATKVTDVPGCTGPVSISVTAGVTPTFSWAPNCKVYYLDVGVQGSNEEIWAVANFEQQNTIPSGVKFGSTPAGSRVIEGPVALRAGTTYTVFVAFYMNGSETDGGRATFTP